MTTAKSTTKPASATASKPASEMKSMNKRMQVAQYLGTRLKTVALDQLKRKDELTAITDKFDVTEKQASNYYHELLLMKSTGLTRGTVTSPARPAPAHLLTLMEGGTIAAKPAKVVSAKKPAVAKAAVAKAEKPAAKKPTAKKPAVAKATKKTTAKTPSAKKPTTAVAEAATIEV